MKTVRINRAKWANASNDASPTLCSYHKTKNESRCCLGFAVNQLCRIPYFNLEDESLPSDLEQLGFTGPNLDLLKKLENQAVRLNDSNKITNKKREQKLIALFNKHNIKLEFYGEERESLPLIWSL